MFPNKSLRQQQLLDLQEIIAAGGGGGTRMPTTFNDYNNGGQVTPADLNVQDMNHDLMKSSLINRNTARPHFDFENVLYDNELPTSLDHAILSQQAQLNAMTNQYRQRPPVNNMTRQRYEDLIALEHERQRELTYRMATGTGFGGSMTAARKGSYGCTDSTLFTGMAQQNRNIQDLLRLQEKERLQYEELRFIREHTQQNSLQYSTSLDLDATKLLRVQEQQGLRDPGERSSLRQHLHLNNSFAAPVYDVQAKLEQRYNDITTQDRVMHRSLMSMTAAGLISPQSSTIHTTNGTTTSSLGTLSHHSTMREDSDHHIENLSRSKWHKDAVGKDEKPNPVKVPKQKQKKKEAICNDIDDGAGSNHDGEALQPKPKRPLSAYNIFFQKERQKLLNLKNVDKHNTSTLNEGEVKANDNNNSDDDEEEGDGSCASDSKMSAVDKSSLSSPNKIKNKKYEPHAKMSFENMGKTIAQRWKAISDDESQLKYYKEIAQKEQLRYRTELKEWKRQRRNYNKSH